MIQINTTLVNLLNPLTCTLMLLMRIALRGKLPEGNCPGKLPGNCPAIALRYCPGKLPFLFRPLFPPPLFFVSLLSSEMKNTKPRGAVWDHFSVISQGKNVLSSKVRCKYCPWEHLGHPGNLLDPRYRGRSLPPAERRAAIALLLKR